MRVVIQRVSKASVSIGEEIYSQIQQGLIILLGIENNDIAEDVEWLSNKIANLRIFSDENGQMNKSILDVKGQVLVVSQFTLHAKIQYKQRESSIIQKNSVRYED